MPDTLTVMVASKFMIPLPRRARRNHEHAMAWAQTVLTGFERNGWTVRDGWTLDVAGRLEFEATYEDPNAEPALFAPRTGTVTDQEMTVMQQRFREAVTESGMTVLPQEYSDEAQTLAYVFDRLNAGGREDILTGRADLHYDCSRGWVIV